MKTLSASLGTLFLLVVSPAVFGQDPDSKKDSKPAPSTKLEFWNGSIKGEYYFPSTESKKSPTPGAPRPGIGSISGSVHRMELWNGEILSTVDFSVPASGEAATSSSTAKEGSGATLEISNGPIRTTHWVARPKPTGIIAAGGANETPGGVKAIGGDANPATLPAGGDGAKESRLEIVEGSRTTVFLFRIPGK